LTLFNLNIRWPLTILTLLSVVIFVSCATHKKPVPPPPVVVSAQDSIESYSCGFGNGTYTGNLPCYGDECNDFGSPLTMLFFGTKQVANKKLKMGLHVVKNISGKWSIDNACIIEINYEDGSREYYKFHEGVKKIEKLNANKAPFPGALNKHNYLSKLT